MGLRTILEIYLKSNTYASPVPLFVLVCLCVCSIHIYHKWHFLWVYTHDTTHITLIIWKPQPLSWNDSTVAQKCGGQEVESALVRSLFKKAPSENHPIKISFHLSSHFMRLNKGNASSAVGREWVLLGWFHRSTDWIILTVALIDLARPPFLLSVKYATGRISLWDFV